MSNQDTDIGGPAPGFPLTRCSVLQRLRSGDAALRQQALATLVQSYWKPVYKYIRIKNAVPNEDAKDLTQSFFARALEKDFFDRYDPAKARFRTYLRVCVDRLIANERLAAQRLKRGGGAEMLSLDFAGAEGELALDPEAESADPEAFFHREWARSLFALAVEDLRSQCAATGRQLHFEVFQRYDLDGPERVERLTYEDVGRQLGLSASQVTNYLAAARRLLRQSVLDSLREATGTEEEFQEEARRILGGRVP